MANFHNLNPTYLIAGSRNGEQELKHDPKRQDQVKPNYLEEVNDNILETILKLVDRQEDLVSSLIVIIPKALYYGPISHIDNIRNISKHHMKGFVKTVKGYMKNKKRDVQREDYEYFWETVCKTMEYDQCKRVDEWHKKQFVRRRRGAH